MSKDKEHQCPVCFRMSNYSDTCDPCWQIDVQIRGANPSVLRKILLKHFTIEELKKMIYAPLE